MHRIARFSRNIGRHINLHDLPRLFASNQSCGLAAEFSSWPGQQRRANGGPLVPPTLKGACAQDGPSEIDGRVVPDQAAAGTDMPKRPG